MKKNKNIEAKASKVIETATANAEVINQEVAQAIATENATEVKNNAKESAAKSPCKIFFCWTVSLYSQYIFVKVTDVCEK